MDKNLVMMGVDIASMNNVDVVTGQIVYDTVSLTVLVYDGSVWRHVKHENKFEKRKRIISKLLNEK